MKNIFLVFLILLFSCSKGPNSEALQKEVRFKLDSFQGGLFQIKDFARRGSYTYSDNGPHLLIYFKMQIELLKDYEFGDWKQLGANSLISVLGSTEAGIQGINPKGNKKGDVLTVYGSNNYKQNNENWVLTQSVTDNKKSAPGKKGFVSDIDAQEALDKGQRPAYQKHLDQLKQLSKELAKNGKKNPDALYSFESQMRDLIEETQIAVDSSKGILGIATAENGGEYNLFGQTVQSVLTTKKTKYKSYPTRGSLSNIDYISNKKITFGIAQGDMLAVTTNQDSKLAAVMSLFPEAIHVVALKSSSMTKVEDLKNKRVNLGRIGSGSHFHAKLVLAMHDMGVGQVTPSYLSLDNALRNLKAGNIDAVFFTGAYPFKPLLDFVKTTPIKLLHLSKPAIQQLSQKHNITLTIPKNTYPNQDENLIVAGTSAVLFTHKETPSEVVKSFLSDLFSKQKELASKHKRTSKFSKENHNKGVLLEFHPAAKEFFRSL